MDNVYKNLTCLNIDNFDDYDECTENLLAQECGTAADLDEEEKQFQAEIIYSYYGPECGGEDGDDQMECGREELLEIHDGDIDDDDLDDIEEHLKDETSGGFTKWIKSAFSSIWNMITGKIGI
jgi:hypothetical protein